MRPARTRLNDTLGAVLVGGASSRFGSDKASAMFRGQQLANRALHTLRDAGLRHLVYVGGHQRPGMVLNAAHVADFHDVGPCALRGVVAALQHAAQGFERAMLLACDVPLVSSDTVARVLAALNDDSTCQAAVATGSRDHWSCVATRCDVLPGLSDILRGGQRSMHQAFGSLRLRRVAVEESEFVNVNTVADLEAATRGDEHAAGDRAVAITDDAGPRG